ncbi:hypothetical protein [Novosphingobium olei]|uniref:hypothetical protein n=1 Tax=Novosphingobium olei TaxID=2728851 RepID=UPI003092A734|nr:hypothetical protein NSDW_04540 [Novosphingobium olei]
MSSRLTEAARRLRVASGYLNNADDVALINEYADELESLADKAQGLTVDTIGETRASIIKTCLDKAFPIERSDPFNGLLFMLDERYWSDQDEQAGAQSA